ncbi:MAG: YfhO family protein [Microgenomates group bacterium]
MQVKFFSRLSAFVKRHQDLFAVSLLVLLIFGFFYKTIFFGKQPIPSDDLVGLYHPWRDAYAHTFQNGVPYKNFLITDPIRQQIPWRKQVIDAFKQKKMPLWDATSFSGAPLLGNIQSGALYPLNVLFFIFPFITAWSILIISQPLLGGIFLYLFLRHKQLEPLACLVGSICFAFSGFSVSWLTWGTIGSTILWLPLILLSFDKLHASQRKIPWRLVFIFASVSSFFAGHLQMFFYTSVLFLAYAVISRRRIKMTKVYSMHVVVPLIIIILTSPVWIRFLSVFTSSARSAGSAWNAEGFFIPIRHLLQFVAPDFFGNPTTLNYWGTWNYGEMIGYIGVVGLVLAIVGISKATAFWVLVSAVCLFFSVDGWVARLPFKLHIPFLSSLQPTRLLGIVDFALSILAAYGLSELLKDNKKKLLFGVLAVGVFFGVTWMFVYYPSFLPIADADMSVVKRNLILPTVVYAVLFGISVLIMSIRSSWKIMRGFLCFGLFVLLSFELVRFGWKFTPFTDQAYFYPKTEIIERLTQMKKPFRVIATDDRLVPPNVLSYYNIESVAGYDPMYTSRYEEYIAAMERGEPNITPPFGFNRIITPKTITSPLLSLLNVRYVLSMDMIVSPAVRLLSEEGTTKLYSVVKYIPRVYFAEQFFFEKSKEGVMNRLYSKEFIPGSGVVLEGEPFIVGESAKEDTVEIEAYEGDSMMLRSSAKNSRFLVIGNMMDSHWQVFVDGTRVETQRVNYLFFGCVIPDGTHVVAVQYK